jgi:hypothetical protein
MRQDRRHNARLSTLPTKQYAEAAKAKQICNGDPGNSENLKLASFSEFYLKYADAADDLQKALDLQRKTSQEDSHTVDALAKAMSGRKV